MEICLMVSAIALSSSILALISSMAAPWDVMFSFIPFHYLSRLIVYQPYRLSVTFRNSSLIAYQVLTLQDIFYAAAIPPAPKIPALILTFLSYC